MRMRAWESPNAQVGLVLGTPSYNATKQSPNTIHQTLPSIDWRGRPLLPVISTRLIGARKYFVLRAVKSYVHQLHATVEQTIPTQGTKQTTESEAMTTGTHEREEKLLERIATLEAEIRDLKAVSLFSDIQPIIEEKPDKFRKVEIGTVGLSYRIRWQKPDVLRELWQRVAQDLKQSEDGIQLLDPVRGTVLRGDEGIDQFVDETNVIHLEFQFAKSSHTCDHDHSHSHDESDDDDFSDDDWDNGCSCSHH